MTDRESSNIDVFGSTYDVDTGGTIQVTHTMTAAQALGVDGQQRTVTTPDGVSERD